MLNDDCIEHIYKIYYTEHCLKNIHKLRCPQCNRMKQERIKLCNPCSMIEVGFTPSFIMMFTGWTKFKQNVT